MGTVARRIDFRQGSGGALVVALLKFGAGPLFEASLVHFIELLVWLDGVEASLPTASCPLLSL